MGDLVGRIGGNDEVTASGSVALSEGTLVQVAIVFDSAGDVMSLYQDGSFVGSAAWTQRVDHINDVSNRLGRSQYYNDEELAGQIHEFRIYSSARSSSELQASAASGPDTPPTQ